MLRLAIHARKRFIRRPFDSAIIGLPLLLLACGPEAAAGTPQSLEAERMRVGADAGHTVRDASASGKRALCSRDGDGLVAGSAYPRVPCWSSGFAPRRARALPGWSSGSTVGRRCRNSSTADAGRGGSCAGHSPPAATQFGCAWPIPTAVATAGAPFESTASGSGLRHGRRRADPAPPPATPGGIWLPAPDTTWQWQLTTPVDQSVDAAMFDIDLFDNSAGVVAALHARGRQVVCYMSAGSVEPGRPDTGEFPAAILGQPLDGWPDERWLDIRRLDVLGPIIERRLDLCKAKGFDGVEPDNVDALRERRGFPLTAADQLAVQPLPRRGAHARDSRSGSRTTSTRCAQLEPYFDFALNEQCLRVRRVRHVWHRSRGG